METQAPQIYKRMADIMQDIDAITKSKTNTQQNYKFRGIDDVYNAINPLFKKHRVFMTTEILEAKREDRPSKSGGVNIYTILTVKIKYFTEDGSFVESTTQGEAMDSADKGSNKAMAVAQKYSIIQTFAIPTEEMKDTDQSKIDDADALQLMIEEALKFSESEPLIEWANNQSEWCKNKKFVEEVNKQIKKLKSAKK